MAIVLLKSCQFAPHYEEPVVDLTDDVVEIVEDTKKDIDEPKTDNQPIDMEIEVTSQPVENNETPLWKINNYPLTTKAKKLLKETGLISISETKAFLLFIFFRNFNDF